MQKGNNHTPILKFDSLNAGYHRKIVVGNASATVDKPGVIALVGANGCGKSTLLKTISGEQKPISGDVYITGKSLSAMSGRELSNKVAIVTSNSEIAGGGLSVRQLVSLGRQPYTGFYGRLSRHDNEIIDLAMEATGISRKQDDYVATLSDGERQKTMIARALAQQTPVLLLDEPFSFLDPAAKIEIFSMLKMLATTENKLIVLSTHDIAQALRMASMLWIITEGKFASLTPAEAINSGIINNLYHSRSAIFDPATGDFILNDK